MKVCEIKNNRGIIRGDFKTNIFYFLSQIEGRKTNAGGQVTFESTGHNINVLKSIFPEMEIIDHDKEKRKIEEEIYKNREILRRPSFQYVMEPRKYQKDLEKHWGEKKAFGVFMDMGTGKTKVTIDFVTRLWCKGEVDAAIVLTPKGVHHQWIDEQIPEHTHKSVSWEGQAWEGKKLKKQLLTKDSLCWATANVDAVKSSGGRQFIDTFMDYHQSQLVMIIDESQLIKNSQSKRSIEIMGLGQKARFRVILTGTPIAKDLTDEWSQFKFLDPDIIGEKYVTTFRSNYCVMGGFQNTQVIKHKNMDRFKGLTAPYCFRVTKDDALDLPEKVRDSVMFEMTKEQRKIISSIRDEYRALLEEGSVTVKNAIGALLRIQQVTCGHIQMDGQKGAIGVDGENPRLEAMMRIIGSRQGKTVIWGRFNHDIEVICDRLKKEGFSHVAYTGKTSDKDRITARNSFLAADGARFFVGNPSAGGTGLNLQGECRTVIYYSNSFNALDRWQSEDRVHRIGMKNTITYFDLICRGSTDSKILQNIKKKKSISSMALSDLQSFIFG